MPTRGFKWIQDTGGAPSGNEHKGSYARKSIKLRSKIAPSTKAHQDKTKIIPRQKKYDKPL